MDVSMVADYTGKFPKIWINSQLSLIRMEKNCRLNIQKPDI